MDSLSPFAPQKCVRSANFRRAKGDIGDNYSKFKLPSVELVVFVFYLEIRVR